MIDVSESLRLMCVHAHPDDESSKGAATMARYVDEGVDVLVVTCTGGERGSILNPQLAGRPEIEQNIPAVRRAEMEHARSILGVRQSWLGFVDSGFPDREDEADPPPLPQGCFALAPLDEPARALVAELRRFRPQVMTTYNEVGGYPHPDHLRTHEVCLDALAKAADPQYCPELGEPWQVLKVYYDVAFNPDRFHAIGEVLVRRGLKNPFAEWFKVNEERAERAERRARPPKITTRVQVADWFERRDAALLAHATQVDPDGWFFAVPLDIQKEAWPTEDFELVHSLVDSALPEDDLFAGIREPLQQPEPLHERV
jgi:mycothiol S-conjugate amidase